MNRPIYNIQPMQYVCFQYNQLLKIVMYQPKSPWLLQPKTVMSLLSKKADIIIYVKVTFPWIARSSQFIEHCKIIGLRSRDY